MNEGPRMDRLHAFVDGELNADDKARFLDEMERDPELRQTVCEMRRLKEYVSCAFDLDVLPVAAPQPTRIPRRYGALGVAASALLTLGFLIGRASAPVASWQPMAIPDVAQDPVRMVAVAHPVENRRVLLHVDDGDVAKFMGVLNGAEDILAFAPDGQVEVVANASGLDLLLADRSPFAERVADLMAQHPNVRFVACNITLKRERDAGGEPVLVKGATTAPSAAEHIIKRMGEGWVYLRV